MTDNHPTVAGLLLAAGHSQRFGSDKRRALLPCGRSLLQASLAHAVQAFAEVWLVLREDDDPAQLGVNGPVRIVRGEQTILGMGHSLACAARALRGSDCQALAVLLADMPWLGSDTLKQLQAHAHPQRIVIPRHHGQRGHPVLIGRRFWPLLEELQGDQGARSILQAHPDACHWLDVDDPGVLLDADTPDALQQAIDLRLPR